jgi:hypothetical protein
MSDAEMIALRFDDWAVVWRKNHPVAAFATREIAQEWIESAPHRRDDVIATWANKRLMREYWAEAQLRSRLKRAKLPSAQSQEGPADKPDT